MDIILYLIQLIQELYAMNGWLINFICKYIPLKQWAFDDSHSPKYQKYKIESFRLLFITNRTGIGKILFLSMKKGMARKSNQYLADLMLTFRKTAPVPDVKHLPSISTVTMVPNARFPVLLVHHNFWRL